MKALTQLSNIVSLIGIVGLVFLFVTSGAAAEMLSMFKKETVVLCPEVRGRILNEDVPVSGVTVTRDLHYGKQRIEKTVTNENGEFRFSEKTIRSSKPNGLFSGNSKIRQVIYATLKGSDFLLWYAFPIGTSNNAAIAKRLSKLNCDIVNEEMNHYFPSSEFPDAEHSVSSICRWND